MPLKLKCSEDNTLVKFILFCCYRFHNGDVLITFATGLLTDAEAERAGLVPTHAYAMLDIREAQVTHYTSLYEELHLTV